MVRIAVLISGGGTNLQGLLDRFADNSEISISLVVSDRAEAGGLKRAQEASVKTAVQLDHRDGPELSGLLSSNDIDAVVLAGYLRLVPADVVNTFKGRMINIHPALLPAFGGPGMYGQRVHEAVLAAGATVSGPTVHLVTNEYDRGTILAQLPVDVLADDTADTLAARVLAAEHKLLPHVVSTVSPDGIFQRTHPGRNGQTGP